MRAGQQCSEDGQRGSGADLQDCISFSAAVGLVMLQGPEEAAPQQLICTPTLVSSPKTASVLGLTRTKRFCLLVVPRGGPERFLITQIRF